MPDRGTRRDGCRYQEAEVSRRNNKPETCSYWLFFACLVKAHHDQLFETEVYVWSKLKHPHVLDLLGFVTCEDTGYPLLISEWMVNGTAWNYVQGNPGLSLAEIVSIVRSRQFLRSTDTKVIRDDKLTDVADGLHYLHNNGIVHSDIKSVSNS